VLDNFRSSAQIWRRYIEQGVPENGVPAFSFPDLGNQV
jgi:hypothetical protein